jgi:hypothetical protein
MFNTKSTFGGLLALSLVLAGTVNAKETKAKSTQEEKSLLSDVLSKTTMSWGGEFYGPAISDMNSRQMNGLGKDGGAITLYNSVSLGYKLGDSGTQVFINPRFFLEPVEGGKYVGDDLRIGVKNGSMVKSGNWNLYGKLDAKIPTTNASIDKGRLLSPGPTFLATFSVPKSRLSLDLWAYGRANIYTTGNADKNSLLSVGLAPAATYRLTPALAAVLYTEYNGVSMGSDAFDFATAEEDFFVKTMASWDINSKVNVSPYVRFYPNATAGAMDTAALGFEASATVF